jgi:predicted nucleic acid-binding protein
MALAYFDSCIVIYYFEGTDATQQALRAAVAQAGEITIAVSELSRFECRVGPLKRHQTDLLQRYDAFFAAPQLRCLPITRAVADRAAELRAHEGLKAIDALHLATAIEGKCDEFWTNDDRLARAAAAQLRIVKPLESVE